MWACQALAGLGRAGSRRMRSKRRADLSPRQPRLDAGKEASSLTHLGVIENEVTEK